MTKAAAAVAACGGGVRLFSVTSDGTLRGEGKRWGGGKNIYDVGRERCIKIQEPYTFFESNFHDCSCDLRSIELANWMKNEK